MAFIFEHETCSRCHGSGQYSFCQDYGTRCFRCAGHKVTLTKRGRAAQAYFIELCTVSAESIQIGDKVQSSGITNNAKPYRFVGTVIAITKREGTRTITLTKHEGNWKFYIKTSVQFDDEKGGSSSGTVTNEGTEGTTVERFTEITLTLSSKYGETRDTSKTYRIYRADDNERVKQALAYQETLTKTGTPRKRRA